jgi:biotin-dependent carboxylase-like uncharacterized protein
MTLLVEAAGALSLVQDLGRRAMGRFGVSASGAFDRPAMRQANRLVGNDPGAAVVETFGGLVLLAESTHAVAVTGASGPITLDGRPAAYGRALRVSAGQRLTIGVPAVGLRTYVGLAGGLAHPRELTSRSTDTLAGLGPSPLAAGDRVDAAGHRSVPPLHDLPALDRSGDLTLDVVLGPREDWFAPAAVSAFLTSPWRVSPASSRVGVRLDGAVLARAVQRELPSEPCVRGSVQVAADGRPIVLGPDHPVTGGYPVIAVVVDAHTDRLAQARAGQVVRFARVT